MYIARRSSKSKTEALYIPTNLGEEPILAGMIVLLDNEAYFLLPLHGTHERQD
jgi:hypothetical protein